MFGALATRLPGGRHLQLIATVAVGIVVALIVFGVMRGQHVAEWAPLTVINSHEPLQELPIRVAQGKDPVEPAHTYDAVLDLSSIKALVVGVDLDYIPKGLARYDAVIRNSDGSERFRGRIVDDYLREGRCMLRLLAKRFPAGDYTLDIEGFDPGVTEGRVVASSWFQVTH
ncbi:MAG TPA: hypothetical protein VFH33_02105 [Candidatus Krumholzibacteria bacterium]|nr:hypothetical protein [Candidatus Krumholzibacteria bacterium]